MKNTALFTLAFLAMSPLAVVHAAIKSQDPTQERNQTIQSYRELLTRIPPELHDTKATAWTKIQREVANAALKEAFIQPKARARLRLKVGNVADWSGLTLHAEVPNHEGYKIDVFGKFSDDWKARLETIKKGDTVTLEGFLSSVTYRDLWGKFTLAINLKDCTFTK